MSVYETVRIYQQGRMYSLSYQETCGLQSNKSLVVTDRVCGETKTAI